ncbi:MAG: hypothetical protein ABL984_13440 [Pyrinomonadaceae bacterium]
MFKKIVFFALFLAVTGLFAATSVNAQRLIKVTKAATSTDTLLEPVPEAISYDRAQCANGGVGDTPKDCGAGGTSANWEGGNMNGSKAHYPEGSNVHYRYNFNDLTAGTPYKFTIAYDAWEGIQTAGSRVHTFDYLNTYDVGVNGAATVGYTVNPCGGISSCSGAPFLFNIPMDPTLTDVVEPALGVRKFAAWGVASASATFVTPSNPNAGERMVELTFTPAVGFTTVVIAWSGHVAVTPEWSAAVPGDQGATLSRDLRFTCVTAETAAHSVTPNVNCRWRRVLLLRSLQQLMRP